jgi:S1-C subfamily serine protease
MALFNPKIADAVVLIEEQTAANSFKPLATGFLIGFIDTTSKDSTDHRLFLATNRHVFQGKSKVSIRHNTRGGAIKRFEVSLEQGSQQLWLAHKNPQVDLALLTVSPQGLDSNGVRWEYIPEGLFAYASDFGRLGISLGDGIFALGFPMGIAGKLQNYVIARGGVIARADEEIIKGECCFLVDASIFPGNSGGPILLKPELVSIIGTQSIKTGHLVGIVSGYIRFAEPLYSHQTSPPTIVSQSNENSHLAAVVPMDFAREIYRDWIKTNTKLLQPALKDEEKASRQNS